MPSKCALLWDESFLWGLTAYRALKKSGLAFTLISSEEIRQGGLSKFKALLVPGGWASNKMKALREAGAEEIRGFVRAGGSYVGICGGAGLAISGGLGLANIRRKPLKERAPSISGPVRVALLRHPVWKGIKEPVFNIWWPSQFAVEDDSLTVLARFQSATPQTFTSDLNAFDVENGKADGKPWEKIEAEYDLNLDPARMKGDPLVVEGAYGKGKVLLSLIHWDTPDDGNGARAFKSLWDYLGLEKRAPQNFREKPAHSPFLSPLEELHAFGLRNFLWFERGPLIQWRRGVRGLEYFTLLEMAGELARRAKNKRELEALEALEDELKNFCDKAKKLLLLERLALQRGEALTFSRASSPEMQSLRASLFGNSKSHGGEFKALLDKLDALLYIYLKKEHTASK